MRTREWSGVDYYRELGLTADASAAAVDEAFRRQAKALHPDRNPDPDAEDHFKRLTIAYEVLRDPVTRQAYDDFRDLVANGSLYAAPTFVAGPATAARQTDSWSAAYQPRPKPRRPRRRLPNRVRVAIGAVLLVLALATALWALLGDLPAPTEADTTLAVQITLGIMAAKLAACGVVIIKYPQLRARWHRPPGAPGAPGAGDPARAARPA
jgi:hypothetical protein